MSRPTNFAPADATGDDVYAVTVTNTGDAPSNGGPITITDELPEGLTLNALGASGEDQLVGAIHDVGGKLACVLLSCTYTGVVVPDDSLVITFPVNVANSPAASCGVAPGTTSCVRNVIRVTGGGALDAAMVTPTTISSLPAGFGISPGGASTTLSTTQAGAHADLTTSIAFNTVNRLGALAGDPKDTTDDLAPGFAGDLVDTPSCAVADLALGTCPVATQIGVVTLDLVRQGHESIVTEPVYNLSPNPGEVAKLGFLVFGEYGIQGDVSLLPGNYEIRTTFHNINEVVTELDSLSLTVWGVPAAPIHDELRFKPAATKGGSGEFGGSSEAALAPFLTNPTSCGSQPLEASFAVDSWEEPERFVEETMRFGPLVGCDRLGMEPTLSAETTTNSADAPSGFDLSTKIPQTNRNAEGLASSTLEQEVVTLPEGMTVNPSSGAGLAACSEAQFAEEDASDVPGVGCPNESKLATVKIVTPALSEEADGSVFLAQPAPFGELGHNPFNSLLALYLVARIPNRGILIKTPGTVELNPETGRLVTTFDNLPPLPFSVATFSFNQGANAPLVTPPVCGSFEVTAQLTPSSDPQQTLTPLVPPFPITTNCPFGGVPLFAPQVIAGTENNAAGSYSPLYLRISRSDGEQEITGFSTVLPPGLTGDLNGVAQCDEAEVQHAREQTGAEAEASPACPAGSEIGHTIAEAGVGSVLAQTPGRLYLGGPYEGAPFSVVSVTSAKVGPFDLGTVVVHLPLDINRETAQVSIPSGPADQIPHIIKGIVIHLRTIRVYIDREHFMLNPTSCAPSTLSATVLGNGPSGNTVTVNDQFQVADCSSLAFEPKFQVSTSGKTSKADGASLHVKLTYPANALGNDSNIKQVKVELPEQLPSRLTTLQKACTQAQFRANPAGCPAASLIGTAKAITPILPVPLEGPVYFVSNGGEAFPNLIMVLQGDGVTIDLVGDTFISKSGITSSTFKTVPDQPVSTFELTLPEGKFSALAANGNLCGLTKTVSVKKKVTVKVKGKKKQVTRKVKEAEPASLSMPTEFVGQNGAVIHEITPVRVIGCPPTRAKVKAAKHAKGKGRNKRGRKKQ